MLPARRGGKRSAAALAQPPAGLAVEQPRHAVIARAI
jgi:hypothetical protein